MECPHDVWSHLEPVRTLRGGRRLRVVGVDVAADHVYLGSRFAETRRRRAPDGVAVVGVAGVPWRADELVGEQFTGRVEPVPVGRRDRLAGRLPDTHLEAVQLRTGPEDDVVGRVGGPPADLDGFGVGGPGADVDALGGDGRTERHEADSAEVVDARVVDDGDMLSAGGITAGVDLALWLVEREWGHEVAYEVENALEYQRSTDVYRER